MGFLSILFGKPNLILTVTVSKSANKLVIEHNFNKTVTEKELMITTMLLLTRWFRILSGAQEKKDIAQNFILWHTEFADDKYSNYLFKNLLQIFKPMKALEKFPKEIRLEQLKNEIFRINVKIDNYDDLDNMIFVFYDYVIDKLSLENQIKLLDGCSLLSAHYLNNGMTMTDATALPRQLIDDYFYK